MSTGARHAAYLVPETVYGVTDATPAFTRLRHTGLSLGVSRESLTSEELRPDRQVADFRLGSKIAGGDLTTELSYGAFDDLLEAVFLGTWAAKGTITATTLSVTAASDTISDSGAGFAGFESGDRVTITGFGDGANNGTFVIDSVTTTDMVLFAADGVSDPALADEAAGASATIVTAETRLNAGTVRRSFSVLRHFTDIVASGDGKPYHLFNGVEAGGLSLNITPGAMVGAVFSLLGREGVAPSNSAPAGATFAEPSANAPLDGFTGSIYEGANALACVTELTVELQNGLEPRNVVGSLFTKRPTIGNSTLTGSATIFFEDALFVERFLNETETALSMEFPDTAGNLYTLVMPRNKFTGGQPDVSGPGAVTLSMPFQGLYDSVTGTNIQLRRLPAP